MGLKLLTEQCLEILSSWGGYTDLSEATLVKMQHCWKSRVTVHLVLTSLTSQTAVYFWSETSVKYTFD